jgi:RimJ/RimL family protein N-acetyltransferase
LGIARGYGLFAVDEQESRRFVGWTGLLCPEGWPAIEIASGITTQRWNKGFATEAATAVRNYAFATLRIPRLVSLIHPDNSASIRVAEKIGERFDHMLDFEGKTVRLYAIASPG